MSCIMPSSFYVMYSVLHLSCKVSGPPVFLAKYSVLIFLYIIFLSSNSASNARVDVCLIRSVFLRLVRLMFICSCCCCSFSCCFIHCYIISLSPLICHHCCRKEIISSGYSCGMPIEYSYNKFDFTILNLNNVE